jgi:sigma54-dependent transcription regulator
VGGTRTLKVDVRVVAATNRFLPQAVAYDGFRSDLFYWLNVFPVHIPPRCGSDGATSSCWPCICWRNTRPESRNPFM